MDTPTITAVRMDRNQKHAVVRLSCGHTQAVKRSRKEKSVANGVEILLARMTAQIGTKRQCPDCQRRQALEEYRAPYDYVVCPSCRATITLPESYFSPKKHMLLEAVIDCPSEGCGEEIDIEEAWAEMEVLT